VPLEGLSGEITAPLGRIQNLIALAADRLGNPLLGLDLAERVPSGAYGVVVFLVRSAPTVERSLAVICELAPLINPIGDFRLMPVSDGCELHYAVHGQRDTIGRHLNEYTIAFIAAQFGAVLGEPMPLSRAWFSHTRPSGGEAVAQRLRTDVVFQRPDCGFAISHETAARVPRTADAQLFEFLLAQARAQLAYVGTHDVVAQVVRVIEVRLAHGDVGTAAIAGAMATTSRSLQRRLTEAGTTFRDVLAYVRARRRAQLERGGFSETEIARQLGFADARSMRRSLDT
jgi:AraC-like DNA-binding protein